MDRFVCHRDEAAVSALVGRHGAMVLGVCRRVLGNSHDADDAFQATFLVLARRAETVQPSGQVGRWLHGVAVQTARKARAIRARRLGREVATDQVAAVAAAPDPSTNLDHADLLGRLDRAIGGLPGRYRTPVVLCLLEGRTHREAADLLGWPVGTVSGRLSRARALLTRRLRAGSPTDPPATGWALPLLSSGQVAAVSRAMILWGAGRPNLVTVGSAPVLALTSEVVRTMMMSKIRLIAALLLGAGLVVGGGVGLSLARSNSNPNPGEGQPADARPGSVAGALDRRGGGIWRVRLLRMIPPPC